jgi:HlyD family secretion protein
MRIAKERVRLFVGTGIILLIILVLVGAQQPKQSDTTQQPPTPPTATTASLLELIAMQQEPITFVGEVRSSSYAELYSNTSGQVQAVFVNAGDAVAAETVLAVFENDTEQAQVAEARAALTSARASLTKVLSGARSEDIGTAATEVMRSSETVDTAYANAQNAYAQALSLVENALFAQTDTFFSNPHTARPTFRVRSADINESIMLEETRVTLGKELAIWNERVTANVRVDDTLLNNAESVTSDVQEFLSTIANFVSLQTREMVDATTRATQEQHILTARTAVNNARSTLIGAKEALSNAVAAAQTAALQEERTLTGERPEDIAISEAAVSQAEARVAAAEAALARTQVRAPISGTVTTLNITQGDFVTPQESVAVVSGDATSLQVEAFVSESVRTQITEGQSVRVLGTSITGTVISVAPGLDPATKQARVVIALSETAHITQGAFVTIAYTPSSIITTETLPERIPVPLTAIKVQPNGLHLYTVTNENKVVALPIEEGPLVGTVMLVSATPLPQDIQVLVDARGYAEGDIITSNE